MRVLKFAFSIFPLFSPSYRDFPSLNVDPKHGDQIVRGTCLMPHGLGKSVVVCAWVPPNLREAALAAGADMIGDHALLEEVSYDEPDTDYSNCECIDQERCD